MHLGTWLFTKFYGTLAGNDEFGNKYYYSSKKQGRNIGLATKERRWVYYNGKVEPSRVPPYWHAWLHYITDDIPTEADKKARYDWQKPHEQNLTGTPYRYLPDGHIENPKSQEQATVNTNYEAWKP